MSDNNYNNLNENLQSILPQSTNILKWEAVKRQMTFIDFVNTFDRVERTKHIDLDTDHTHAVYKAKPRSNKKAKEKAGQILSARSQMGYAMANLKQFILEAYNIELVGKKPNFIHTCHLCDHNSGIKKSDKDKHTCTSHLHVYFGVAVENEKDKPKKIRAKGMKSQLAAGTHICQVQKKCPHCGYETKEWQLKGRHIPACHFNPQSHNYLKPMKDSVNYEKQGLSHKLIELEYMINSVYNQRHC